MTNDESSPLAVTQNPYIQSGLPIREPADLFGRKREIGEILNFLQFKQCISVTGARRIGKTSLLYHVSDPSTLESYGIDPNQLLFVFREISCDQFGELDANAVLRKMLEEAQTKVREAGYDVAEVIAPSDELSFFDFSEALGALTATGVTLVFLFDNFEYLARNEAIGPAFFSGLRAIANHLDVAYLTASRRPLLELTYTDRSVLGSPFFNIFATVKLGPFEEPVARELIEGPSAASGVRFSDATVEFLLGLADHHPYYLQVACFHAFEMQSEKGELSEQDYDELSAGVARAVEDDINLIWNSELTEQEKKLLNSSRSNWHDPTYHDLIQSLNDQGVVCMRDDVYQLCDLWVAYLDIEEAAGEQSVS